MKPERWQQIKIVLDSALKRAEPGQRAAFLDEACKGDSSLRREVESLIVSYDQAGSFAERPAFEVMAGSIADEPSESMVGTSLGSYRVLSHLGAGGMGEVYLAEDARLRRKVALKMLPAFFTSDDERVRRFQQEARAASALNHPNILTIYEIGQTDTRHFIATEYIEGAPLREQMGGVQVTIGEALDIAIQVSSALATAHLAGIIHRDIKPDNIMIRSDGYVKVLDFGLAKLMERKTSASEATTLVHTKQGMVMGTPHYMSPEQARGLNVDARTDIFSLGVVLYEMLAGRVPFAGETVTDVLASILMVEPPPLSRSAPGVPVELEDVVTKSLRKAR